MTNTNTKTKKTSGSARLTFLQPQDNSLENIYICDIDGTLAIMGDRSPYNWSKVSIDTPNFHVCKIIKSLLATGAKVIFLSGRDEACREETQKWIFQALGTYEFNLFMRPKNDYRADTIIKKEIYKKEIQDKYFVECVFDDRPSVCRMWRQEIGLNVVHIGNPDMEF